MSRDKKSQRIHLRSAFLGGLVAALIVSALPAIAAQVGDALSLGEANRVNGRTTLRGRALANLMIISEAGGDTNGTALELRVKEGNPPMRVNSSDRVDGFNADLLDGKHATDFVEERWAVVAADGTLTRSKSVVSAIRSSEGIYRVRFDSAVTGCAFSVTPLAENGAFPQRLAGASTGGGSPSDTIGVGIFSPSGDFLNAGFSLVVTC